MLFGAGCTSDGDGAAGDEAIAEITVSPTSFATDLEGGEQVVAVTSNGTWTVSCDQTDVTIAPQTGSGNGSVTITVPAANKRNFEVVFAAQKQTYVPAVGTSTTTTSKAVVSVSQNDGGVNLDDYLYYEKCGDEVNKTYGPNGDQFPYVDQFEGWSKEGEAAANVVYSGRGASVRYAGSANYGPVGDAIGVSDKPYVFLNGTPDTAYFVIENLAVTGGSNYIFTYNVSCQNGYSGAPTFAEVNGSLVHLELGYDGVGWQTVDCTYNPNGGNGWYAVQAEFKVKADATKLYARFTYEAPASNGGGRFDDFKLVAGGSGAELNPVAPAPEPTPEGVYFVETFANNQGAFTVDNVTLPAGLTSIWVFDSAYGMKGSAFANNTCYVAESWLVSPVINLTDATKPALTFSHCVNKANGQNPADLLSVHVKVEGATEWTALTIPTHGTGNSWDFVDSGFVDLTAFAGKNIQIGFKYTSTAEVAPTWEIKNIKVLEKPADVVVPEGTEASVTFSELGYANAFELEGQTIAIGDDVSCQFFKNSGSTAPKYYTTGTAARLYAKNTLVISSEKTIKYIKFTVNTGQAEDNLKADGYDAGSRVWTGESKSITFTQDGSTGHTRIQKIELVYAE